MIKIFYKYQFLVKNITLLIATIIWGSTLVVIKNNLFFTHAITIVFYRFLISSGLMLLLLLILQKNIFKYFFTGVILGILLFFSYASQAIALYYTSVISGGFISGLFIVFVPILSLLCKREKFDWHIFISILIACIGLWYINGMTTNFTIGSFLMLSSATTFAAHILYSDIAVKKNYDILVINFQQFLTVTVISLFVIFIYRIPIYVSDLQVVWWLFYLALFAGVLCYLVQLYAQKSIPPTICAVIFSLEPVFGAFFAWFVNNEIITLYSCIGGSLIIIAVIIVQVYHPANHIITKLE